MSRAVHRTPEKEERERGHVETTMPNNSEFKFEIEIGNALMWTGVRPLALRSI